MEEKEYNDILSYVQNKEYPELLLRVQRSNWRKKCHRFKSKDGELFYNHQKYGDLLVIKGQEKKLSIIEKNHIASKKHSGINKTRREISRRYYWKTIAEDVVKYLRDCEVCKEVSKQRIQAIMPIISHEKGTPHGTTLNETISIQGKMEGTKDLPATSNWHLDILSPFETRTHRGNQYIALLIHMTNRWIEAKPIDRKESTDIICEFIMETIYRHSFMKCLSVSRVYCTDDDEFCTRLESRLQDLLVEGIPELKIMDINVSETCMLKRLFEHYFSKLIKDFQYFWDKYLQQIVFAFNTYNKNGLSSFTLLNGHEPYMPIQGIHLYTEGNNDRTEHCWNYILKLLKNFKIPISETQTHLTSINYNVLNCADI